MKTQIGIITARVSLRNFQAADEPMRQQCDITYLPYSTTMELTNLYLENASRFDGFLFSGAFPHDYLVENVCRIVKPCRHLELADRDFYRIIARLYAQNPGIDFTRVSFDAFAGNLIDMPEYPIFEDIFPPDKMPLIDLAFSYSFYNKNLPSLYDAAFETYRKRWKEGKVDLFVTRLTNLAQRLDKEQIPHVLLQPSPATILDCFHGLLADIQTARVENSLTACCIVEVAHSDPTEEELLLLKKNLEQYNASQNMAFVLRQNGNLFDAVTSGASVRELTSNYTTCLLTSFLFEVLPFSTYIGWGVGFDLVMAHQNALRAMQESKRDPNRYTYLVNESYEMTGPLYGDRTISYLIRPSTRTNRIAKSLGVSPINLEKLISLQQKKQMTDFTASDLVFYLDITARSATRILQKLVSHGGAVQVNSVHLNGRGRPAAVYRVNFDGIQR